MREIAGSGKDIHVHNGNVTLHGIIHPCGKAHTAGTFPVMQLWHCYSLFNPDPLQLLLLCA